MLLYRLYQHIQQGRGTPLAHGCGKGLENAMEFDVHNSFEINEGCGGRDRTRTCDLLRVNQTVPPNSMITEQIFSCKVGIRLTQVTAICSIPAWWKNIPET